MGVQNTADAQFWSFENPLANPQYASQTGMPSSNAPGFDWVMTSRLVPGAKLITRPAPGLGVNAGRAGGSSGAPGSVNIQWFHMPTK